MAERNERMNESARRTEIERIFSCDEKFTYLNLLTFEMDKPPKLIQWENPTLKYGVQYHNAK